MYKILYIRDHVEVYEDGKFVLSADTYSDAMKEVREIQKQRKGNVNA